MQTVRFSHAILTAVLMAAILPVATVAQTARDVPSDAAQIQLSFAPVVREAGPAVVNIYARRITEGQPNPFASDPFFSQFFSQLQPAPRVQNSLGSGVILSPDGLVVSNYHVISGADQIRVVLADRREFSGRVVLADPDTDLAVIRLQDAAALPYLQLADSDAVAVGDLVLAIGNPFGVGQTVTSGIVSGLARAGGNMGQGQGYFIQTDAAVNPGNSGGALVDMAGRLLGINTSILTRSGGSNGIGFAIPANLVGQYLAQARSGATALVQPWAGIAAQTVDAGLAEALGMAAPRGIIINEMDARSPFAAAGLRKGDVITALGGLPVDTPQELDFRMKTIGADAGTTVGYMRAGQDNTAEVQLAAAPAAPAATGPETPPQIVTPENLPPAFAGLQIGDLTPQLRSQLGLPGSAAGVIVLGLERGTRRSQFQPGDVIVEINGQPTTDTAAFESAVSGGGKSWTITYIRNGRTSYLRLFSF